MTPPIVPGKNGMSTVLLSHPSGSSADVYLNGAHVTSWIPAGGREVLFMGKTATFAPGDPIRGGIPVVWPQFANIGPLPQHGFARKTEWQLAENADSSDDPSSVKLVLTDDHRTRELWPYHFRTELTVAIDDKSLHVKRDERRGEETCDLGRNRSRLPQGPEEGRGGRPWERPQDRDPLGGLQGCRRLESVGREGDRIHRARHGRLHEDGVRGGGADRITGGAQARRVVERLSSSGDRVSAALPPPVHVQLAVRQMQNLFQSGEGRGVPVVQACAVR